MTVPARPLAPTTDRLRPHRGKRCARPVGNLMLLKRRLQERSSQSSVFALPVTVASKLRVATAETEHLPIYLRRLFRVLSSWVHHPTQVKRPYPS
jgi:hypothetical protein